MTTLRPDEALTHPGSLLSADAQIVAPYDFEVTGRDIESARALGVQDGIVSALAEPLRINYSEAHAAHIINGMGVTLGDSIIGLTAIQAIGHAHPHVRFTVYRPAEAPRYVEALYALAQGVIADFRPLPWPLAALPADGPRIDVGNHLFWPAFMKLPMIDFFLEALGVDAATVPAAHKANRWLQRLRLPALPATWQTAPYVMFCPTASTPVRSIPASAHTRLVDALARRFDLPVLGFGAVDHPRYIDVSTLSPDTAHFLAWVAKARHLVTSDTAAVHIAAGFDVPTTAFFTTVAPELRVRDYPHCRAIALDVSPLRDIQASSREADLALVEAALRALPIDDSLFAGNA
ncbi:glycosyltransferase family 9 protein [Paraburkholderia kururiensis]|uniref:glycosyltransferase family 9 protein n=1 Tax=Paraburkholderia kururiensis TaxID=984307 RepID=UPI000348A45E|nr:hypothetical protein [Paraburkholderia kururiensis]